MIVSSGNDHRIAGQYPVGPAEQARQLLAGNADSHLSVVDYQNRWHEFLKQHRDDQQVISYTNGKCIIDIGDVRFHSTTSLTGLYECLFKKRKVTEIVVRNLSNTHINEVWNKVFEFYEKKSKNFRIEGESHEVQGRIEDLINIRRKRAHSEISVAAPDDVSIIGSDNGSDNGSCNASYAGSDFHDDATSNISTRDTTPAAKFRRYLEPNNPGNADPEDQNSAFFYTYLHPTSFVKCIKHVLNKYITSEGHDFFAENYHAFKREKCDPITATAKTFQRGDISLEIHIIDVPAVAGQLPSLDDSNQFSAHPTQIFGRIDNQPMEWRLYLARSKEGERTVYCLLLAEPAIKEFMKQSYIGFEETQRSSKRSKIDNDHPIRWADVQYPLDMVAPTYAQTVADLRKEDGDADVLFKTIMDFPPPQPVINDDDLIDLTEYGECISKIKTLECLLKDKQNIGEFLLITAEEFGLAVMEELLETWLSRFFDEKVIPDNHDCLFEALFYSIGHVYDKVKEKDKDPRMLLVEFMENNADAYKDSVYGGYDPEYVDSKGNVDVDKQFTKYCKELKNNRTKWGGDVEIRAFVHYCQTLGKNVRVHVYDANLLSQISVTNDFPSTRTVFEADISGEKQDIYLFHCHQGKHYNVLVLNNESIQKKSKKQDPSLQNHTQEMSALMELCEAATRI